MGANRLISLRMVLFFEKHRTWVEQNACIEDSTGKGKKDYLSSKKRTESKRFL
jgi:hypothetical protein